jgi:uncharacterized protein involved in exopolysaccharide biosynthesis
VISTEYPLVSDRRDEVNVISLLQVAWRYKLLIAAFGLGAALIGVYIALTTRPVYRAEVVVTEVANESVGGASSIASRLGGLAGLAGLNLASGPSREAQAVLNSRHLAQEFIRRYKLVGEILGNSPKQSLWLAVDRFRQRAVSVTESKEKGTIVVAVQWRDPEQAAKWANDYVALANELLRTRALDDSSRNIRYLKEQIPKTDVLEVQRAMYSLVETETKVNMLANTRTEYAFTVVDPAVTPEERIWPRRTLIVLSAGAFGGLLGLLFALVHNMWQRHRTRSAT